jgi:hypothetical protein
MERVVRLIHDGGDAANRPTISPREVSGDVPVLGEFMAPPAKLSNAAGDWRDEGGLLPVQLLG